MCILYFWSYLCAVFLSNLSSSSYYCYLADSTFLNSDFYSLYFCMWIFRLHSSLKLNCFVCKFCILLFQMAEYIVLHDYISAVRCFCIESCTSCVTTLPRAATAGWTTHVRAWITCSNSASSGGPISCQISLKNCRMSSTPKTSMRTGLSSATATSFYGPSTFDIAVRCRTGAVWQPVRGVRRWICASVCQRASTSSCQQMAGWLSAARQAVVASGISGSAPLQTGRWRWRNVVDRLQQPEIGRRLNRPRRLEH